MLCRGPEEGFSADNPRPLVMRVGSLQARQAAEDAHVVCRKCRWAGVVEDLSWGACPECGGRKFADDLVVSQFELEVRAFGW